MNKHHALLLATVLLATPAGLWAQDQADDEDAQTAPTIPVQSLSAEDEEDAAASPAQGNTVLDELVITATPSGDSITATPISVSVTSELELRETNITDLEALSDRLPNAQLSLTPTNTFLFVRGLGTGAVRSAEQSVGFFVDSVFLGRPQVALFDFLDVEQIELLRGPQGAILGKNTVAGAVNVLTAPATEEFEGYAEFLQGSDNQRRERGAISGPLSQTLSARIAYTQVDEDGNLFNTTQNRLDLARPGKSGRAKLLWRPSYNQSYGISVQSARIRQTGDSFELSQASEETLTLYRQFDPETSTNITDRRTHTDHEDSGALVEGQDLIVNGDWEPELGRLRFIASLSSQDVDADFDLDISPAPFLTIPSLEVYEQRSVELRFDRYFDWGDISAGAYYFQSDLDLKVDIKVFEDGTGPFFAPLVDNGTGSGAGSAALVLLGELGNALAVTGATPLSELLTLGSGASLHRLVQDQTTYSGFGSVRWFFAEDWTIRFDGRLTRETKRGDQSIVFEGPSGRALGEALGEEQYELQAQRSETDFSPRLSLLAKFTPAISSYVTIARGFKSGGFNNLAAVPERAEFDEERSLTYEAGVRLRTRYGVNGEVGVFHTKFDNLQVAALDGTEFFVGNAARAHTQGIELSARWEPAQGVMISADLGYLDAKYDDYRNAPARADSDEDSQDLSGKVLQRAPEFSGSLQLGFLIVLPLVNLPLAVGTVAEGASHQFLNIDLDPIDSQPGYLRYNAFVALANPDGKLSLRLIGRNLTDEHIRREAADIAIVGAHSVGLYPPRSLAVELGYRF